MSFRMSLINIFHRLKTQFHTKYSSHNGYKKLIRPFCILLFIAIIIWIAGPYVTWGEYAFLAQPEKRFYSILFLFLIWQLKILLVDYEKPISLQYKDSITRKNITELHYRFHGALRFFNKTTASKQGESLALHELPWYLLIGPKHAGKTTLLANADVNYIL